MHSPPLSSYQILSPVNVGSLIQDLSGVEAPVLSEAAAEEDPSCGAITFFSWAMARI